MRITPPARIALGVVLIASVAGLNSLTSVGRQQPSAAQEPEITHGTLARATFAGGCFWCMEPPFDELDGVVSTTSGYIGGHTANPTYQEVSSGRTGHAEAVEVVYDPSRISYERLLEVFWRNIDPLTANGQFCDFGSQYRTGIFIHTPEQARLAEESKARLDRSRMFTVPIVTEITTADVFYPAEAYHQDYYKKNPIRYRFYRYGCGRDARIEALWGDTD